MTGTAEHVHDAGGAAPSCRNCDATLHGPYCAHCGQDTDTHRRSIASLLGDLISDIASFDSRILRTTRALLFQPGELPLAFHQGRMQRYVPAIRLYFFVTLVFFVVLGATGIAILQLQITSTPQKVFWDANGNAFIQNPAYDKDDPDSMQTPRLLPIPLDRARAKGGAFSFGTEPFFFARVGTVRSPLTAAQRAEMLRPLLQMEAAPHNAEVNWFRRSLRDGMRRLAEDPASINEPLTTWIPRALFLLLPLYAAILALVQWRRRKSYYFVDHVVFSLSIHTFVFAALLAAAGLAQFLPGGWVACLLLLTISVYIFVAMKRFYAQSWFWTSVKFVTVSALYITFCVIPALFAVAAIAFLGGSIG